MPSAWYWKAGFIAAVAILAAWLLVPTYHYFRLPPDDRNDVAKLQERLPAWAPPAKFKLNLGLDLQGGIHLVLGVDVDTAMERKVAVRAGQIAGYAKDKGFETAATRPIPRENRVEVTLPDKPTAEKFEAVAVEGWADMQRAEWTDSGFVLAFLDEAVRRSKRDAVEQAVKSIRNRIDRWGVTEPDVRERPGSNSILVQLPGYKDPARAKELIGKTAQLEFKIADDESRALAELSDLPQGVTKEVENVEGPAGAFPITYLKANDHKLLETAVAGKLPAERELGIACVYSKLARNTCDHYRTYLLKSKTELTGDSVADAFVTLDQSPGSSGRPEVSLIFDAQGAREFERITGENVKRRMAIVLDRNVDSAPVIQSKIGGGHARITLGGFKPHEELRQDASDLVLVLKAGALPAPVVIQEERTVGASLGPELIRKGSFASLLGVALVLLFMFAYYRLSGFIANVALLLDGVLVLAAMAAINSTLTLPGIAGFVLTLGMAVDANVLINERIREELRLGKTPRAAVEAGYSKAFSAIFDSNLTTLVAAGVLLSQNPSGPVRGFAVTLGLGLVISMFTAIVVTRAVFELWLTRRGTAVKFAV